jgi:hypothetical protein
MAATRSDTSCYPSRYGGGHVTIAQYITEYLCENIARSKRQELPPKFWEIEEWASFFKTQIVLLNRQILANEIHPRAVVKALKDRRCFGVNSFGGFLKVPKWKNVLLEHHNACLKQDEQESKLPAFEAPDATKQKPRIPTGKTSILHTLRDIDNEQKENRDSTSE